MVGNVGGDTFAAHDFDYAAYASARPKYPPELFAAIKAAHDAVQGSERDLALDMGCGPVCPPCVQPEASN